MAVSVHLLTDWALREQRPVLTLTVYRETMMADDALNSPPLPRNPRDRDEDFWQLHTIWKLAELDGGQAERELAFRDLVLAPVTSASAAMLKIAALRTFPAAKAAEVMAAGMTALEIIECDLARASQFEMGWR